MPTSYFIRYDAPDGLSQEFLDHYRNHHTKILRRFPGIQEIRLHTPVNWSDSAGVNAGKTSLLAQMIFESPEALDRALSSDARAEAREDFKQFPDYTAEVIHQAMATEIIKVD